MSEIIIGLINNGALLLTLVLLYDLLGPKPGDHNSLWDQTIVGVVIGIIGIAAMMTPWKFGSGVIFDSRSVLLSVSALFFGAVPAIVAVGITSLYRLVLGGVGAWVGVTVIFSSSLVGLFWRRRRKSRLDQSQITDLYVMGLVVHIIMLLTMLALPWPVAKQVLSHITIPVLLVFPLITVLLGQLIRQRQLQYQLQTRLRESEDQFYSAFEQAAVGMAHLGPSGRFIRINQYFCDMMGYTREELLGMSFQDITHPEDAALSQQLVNQCLENPGEIISLDKRYLRKDGHIAWGRVRASVVRGKDGQPQYFSTVVEDIAETHSLTTALQESENKFFKAFHSPRIMMALITLEDGIFLDVNAHFSHITGFKRADVVGKSTSDIELWTKEQRKTIVRDLKTKGFIHNQEMDLSLASGQSIPILWFGDVIKIQGQDCVLSSAYDSIEEKRIEKERAKVNAHLKTSQNLEAIGTLAGGIAHDFNNILASMIGYTELALEEAGEDSKFRDYLQEVYTSGNRAKALVQQILTVARQTEEQHQPVPVAPVIQEVLKLIRSSISTTIDIRSDIESKSLIMGDATQVHQIFMNLLTNAAQAMEEKGGTLTISLKNVVLEKIDTARPPGVKPGNYLEAVVSDTGPGIPPDIIDSIFDPYFTTKAPGEGTGLGLAIVHGIVKSYGGYIFVTSEVGQGTTFRIYFPPIKQASAARPETVDKMPVGTELEHILLVDDEVTLARMTGRILERLGYAVTTRTSSVEAMALFQARSSEFSLLITDMNMANMSGTQLIAEVLTVRPDLPVILCTGFSKSLLEIDTATLGIGAVLHKPIDRAELARTIRALLDHDE